MKTTPLLSIFLASCTGISFADEQVDKPLPQDLRNRTLVSDSSLFKYHLGELVGHVVLRKSDGTFTRLQRIAPSAPAVEVLKDGTLYKSKVTLNSRAQGSYLLFSAALSAEQASEVTIADAAHAYLETLPSSVTDAATRAYSTRNSDLFFVQGVVMSVMTRESWIAIDSDAKGVVGSAAGISGQVYNGQRDFSRDYHIAVELVDLFKMGKLLSEDPFPVGELSYPLHEVPGYAEASTSGGRMIYMIQPLERRLDSLRGSANPSVARAAAKLDELVNRGVHDSESLQAAWDDAVGLDLSRLATQCRATPMGIVHID